MIGNLGGWHLIVILFIILLLFGAPKLPGLAKSLGQSMRILKKEVRPEEEQTTAGADGSPAAAETPADPEAEAARARAEAEAAKRELEQLKAQVEQRSRAQGDQTQ